MAEPKGRGVHEIVQTRSKALPIDRIAAARPSSGRLLGLRLRTRLRRRRLDDDIARGREGPYSDLRAFRELRLRDMRERKRLASALERVLDAYRHPSPFSSAAPIDRPAVGIAKPIFVALIHTLRSAERVDARGIVLGWRLLTDARGPVYASPGGSGDAGGLFYAALSSLLALGPSPRAERAWASEKRD